MVGQMSFTDVDARLFHFGVGLLLPQNAVPKSKAHATVFQNFQSVKVVLASRDAEVKLCVHRSRGLRGG